MKTILTVDMLVHEAKGFARRESQHHERSLFGVTDGKAVGTYLEHISRSDSCRLTTFSLAIWPRKS